MSEEGQIPKAPVLHALNEADKVRAELEKMLDGLYDALKPVSVLEALDAPEELQSTKLGGPISDLRAKIEGHTGQLRIIITRVARVRESLEL